VFTYSVFKAFKMIKRPDDCKIRSVIHVLNAKNVKLADYIVRYVKYAVKMMSDGMVRKWIRKFDECSYLNFKLLYIEPLYLSFSNFF
jgi:hypothetical protein